MQLVPTQQEVVSLLRQSGALRDGHFEYPNGLHSNEYLQVALAMRHYEYAKTLSVGLTRVIRANPEIRAMIPELSVVAPATGGLPVAYGVCEALRAKQVYWAESEDGGRPLRFRQYLEQVPGEKVLLEDLAASAGTMEKLTALLMAWTLPVRLLEKILGAGSSPRLDDTATVIFSSGSTGEPKGVMLTHYNIGSNIQQMNQVFGLLPTDGFLGILPFFHSFGFTGTLCLPAVLGARAVYYPNPLDGKSIGPLVRENAVTYLLATPTFLQIYLRTCAPEDFGSLRVVMTAAEKLPERVASAFEERFGIRPMEG